MGGEEERVGKVEEQGRKVKGEKVERERRWRGREGGEGEKVERETRWRGREGEKREAGERDGGER